MSFSDDDKELRNWMEAKNHQSVNLKQVALLEVPASSPNNKTGFQSISSSRYVFSANCFQVGEFLGLEGRWRTDQMISVLIFGFL